jgi:hypothetical protein
MGLELASRACARYMLNMAGTVACGDDTKRRGRTRVTPGCAGLQEGAAVVDDARKKGREWNEDAALKREER